MLSFYQRAFRGGARLWVAFWVFGVVMQLFWAILATLLIAGCILALEEFGTNTDSFIAANGHILYWTLTVFFYLLWFHWIVAVWRCAWKTVWVGFGVLARIIVAISAVFFVISIVFTILYDYGMVGFSPAMLDNDLSSWGFGEDMTPTRVLCREEYEKLYPFDGDGIESYHQDRQIFEDECVAQVEQMIRDAQGQQ